MLLAADQCADAYCLCKPFSCKACPGKRVPGHAVHEKGLQRQIGVGTLVSSQERRALAVPLINRGSTADFVPPSVYIGFRLFVLPGRRPGQCLRFAGGQEGGLSPGRIDPTASRATQPRSPSPPRRAPPRPDRPVVCPGFGFDKFLIIVPNKHENINAPQHPKAWKSDGR